MRSRNAVSGFHGTDEVEQLPSHISTHLSSLSSSNGFLIDKVSPFMTVMVIASLISHKIVHMIYDNRTGGVLDFSLIETYFWIPSLFLGDTLFTLGLLCFFQVLSSWIQAKEQRSRTNLKVSSLRPLQRLNKWYLCRNIVSVVFFATSIMIMIISSLEIKVLISIGERIQWDMTIKVWKDWDNFKGLIESKIGEGIPVWVFCVFQVQITSTVRSIFSKLQIPLQEILHASCILRQVKMRRRAFYKGLLYLVLVFCMRPENPYRSLSHTPMISIPRAILAGASYGTNNNVWIDSIAEANVKSSQKGMKIEDPLIISLPSETMAKTSNTNNNTNTNNTNNTKNNKKNKNNSSSLIQKIKKGIGGYNSSNNNNGNGGTIKSPKIKSKNNAKHQQQQQQQQHHSDSNGSSSKQRGSGPTKKNKHNARPLNIVLIMLESMRGDMFPFDPTTPWAKKTIPEAASLVSNTTNKVTPFYADWVKKNSTLYIPHLRSASGFTHKSLWSIFCSAYANPRGLTVEHMSKRSHNCFPRILENSGYGYKNHQFFKSITSTLDHQSDLARNMGFERMYGEKEYNTEYRPSTQWSKEHRANYLGYEDDVIIDPMFKWIDSSRAGKEPFFLSYLSGATHDPYDLPPRKSWPRQDFIKDAKLNNFLNEVAYTDRFLSKVINDFQERNLIKETLFVIMGDHGANLKNRDSKITTYMQHAEESFDVGVSFYSENEEVSAILTNVKNSNAVQQGTWSSIDIVPTILDLLNTFDAHNVTKSKLLSGKYSESIVDGRSMLHPSGKRIEFSIANPGDGMVLKDGSYVILVPSSPSTAFPNSILYDLKKDPTQSRPIPFFRFTSTYKYPLDRELIHWGHQAVKFTKLLEIDLNRQHQTGESCTDCALSLLKSLESLDQWDGYENLGTVPRVGTTPELGRIQRAEEWGFQ